MRYILIKISLGLASWLTKSTRLCCSGFLAVASAEGNQSNLMRWRARDASSISTWVKRYSTSERLHIKWSLSPALVVIVVLLSYVSFWSCRRRAQNLHNLIMSSLCVRFANVCMCVWVRLSLWQLFGWLNHDKMEDHFGAIYGFLMAIHQEVVE